jgi:hypothetical protein
MLFNKVTIFKMTTAITVRLTQELLKAERDLALGGSDLVRLQKQNAIHRLGGYYCAV